MTSLRRLFASLIAVLLLLGWQVSPAHADDDKTPSSWRITRHDTTLQLGSDGVGHAVTTLDFDFANDPGHGPFLVFSQRSPIPGDKDHWRKIRVNVEKVTSPTDAPTDLKVESRGQYLRVRVGNPNIKVRGKQTYVVTYTISGIIQPHNQSSQLDELNWSVVGNGWQVPIDSASATVTLPGAPERTACFSGSSFKNPCQASPLGSSVTYRTSKLKKEQGMQIVAGMPLGTFVNPTLETTKRYHFGNTFGTNPMSIGGGLVAALAGLFGLSRIKRRHGTDQAWANTTPGVGPLPGQEQGFTAAGPTETAVRFNPPDDARPGEAGTLVDAKADNRDVTATIVDLAVRGHLGITNLGPEKYEFTRLQSAAPLDPWEQEALDKFMGGYDRLTTDQMEDEGFASVTSDIKAKLYRRVTKDKGWFRHDPNNTRAVVVVAAIVLLLLAGISTAVLALFGLGWVGVGLAVVPLVALFMANSFPARTPAGSAALAQVKGFELYLRTAEADQLRWEEGEDIFSKYLPWAIAFDVADRWVKLFEHLAAQGQYDMGAVGWYYGPMGSFDGIGDIGSSIESSFSAAESAASSSDSSSGFSGGGGFGGGGGGGW